MNEEIVVNIGGSLTGLSTALRGMKGIVKEAGASLKDAFKDIGGELGSELFGAFSVGGAMAEVEKVFQKVTQIKREAETLQVSTDFVQQLQAVGRSAGIGGEEIEKMMSKFLEKLPAGSDLEQTFFKLADDIAAIPDPAERARLAIEEFGKSGVKMIPILAKGSEGIREMADGFSKFSQAEIEAVEQGHIQIEKSSSYLDAFFAKAIYGWTKVIEIIKNRSISKTMSDDIAQMIRDAQDQKEQIEAARAAAEQDAQQKAHDDSMTALEKYQEKARQRAFRRMSPKEQLADLEAQRTALYNPAKDDKDDAAMWERFDKIGEIEDKILDVKKKIGEEDTKQAKAAEEQHQKALKAIEAEANVRAQARAAELQSDSPSLQELANSGSYRVSGSAYVWQQGPYAQLAQQILNLKADVKDAVTYGDTRRRDYDLSQISNLQQSLPGGVEGSTVGPGGAAEKTAAATASIADNIRALMEAALIYDGIRVKGSDN